MAASSAFRHKQLHVGGNLQNVLPRNRDTKTSNPSMLREPFNLAVMQIEIPRSYRMATVLQIPTQVLSYTVPALLSAAIFCSKHSWLYGTFCLIYGQVSLPQSAFPKRLF